MPISVCLSKANRPLFLFSWDLDFKYLLRWAPKDFEESPFSDQICNAAQS